eukprot:TRINITY_DN1261_c0_g1_i1.p1 TRINITY_DN1261_c0_g1~~TRINITY_DN1261_c0_g1_i1.p1  ORF type:complete len:183 (+),score=51.79 TRINITY_DN1261_c0_g1_i1:80-550(+)
MRDEPQDQDQGDSSSEDNDGHAFEDDARHDWDALSDPNKYVLRKKIPIRPRARVNDVFVSRAHPIPLYVKRAAKMLEKDEVKEVYVFGMGAALETAIQVALMVQKELGGPNAITVSPNTDSVFLFDEFQPLQEGLEPVIIKRLCSQIQIILTKKAR